MRLKSKKRQLQSRDLPTAAATFALRGIFGIAANPSRAKGDRTRGICMYGAFDNALNGLENEGGQVNCFLVPFALNPESRHQAAPRGAVLEHKSPRFGHIRSLG